MNIGRELFFFTDNIYYNELNLNKMISIYFLLKKFLEMKIIEILNPVN